MEKVVIIAYKPLEGKAEVLRELVKKNLPCLKQHGLVTNKDSFILETKDGTIVEVFEWVSEKAMKTANTIPAIQDLWRQYAKVSTYTPLNRIPEAGNLFAAFSPLN